MQNKNLKITNKIKEISSKLKWLAFSEMQDYKLTSDYINLLCPKTEDKQADPTTTVNSIIRETLIREFSPEIQNTKSFDLLVDAVAHNLKKKALNEE